MKLLFDQNLSHKLVELLSDVFPGSSHVRIEGLEKADDLEVWDFAAANGFAIVSKDDDFQQLSTRHGSPPKVILLGLGNCTTAVAAERLRAKERAIKHFGNEPTAHSMLVILRS